MIMAKRNGNKTNSKPFNSLKIADNKGLSIVDDNILQCLRVFDKTHDDKESLKVSLIKSESAPSLFDHKSHEYTDIVPQRLDLLGNEKMSRQPKKQMKITDEMEEIRSCSTLRLSHFVIVDSVLKETNINPSIEAKLPVSLNLIYQQFINSKKYIDSSQAKDTFYCGVGLLGIGVEERIYNKRKALEESLKRGFRLRPNPKPRRQFDGTIINRPLKNRNKFTLSKNNAEKQKYNVFTIGNDSINKAYHTPLRKTIKKKSVTRRAAAQKLEQAKKALNEASLSSDEDATPENTKSIALSRTKRQPKVPQLDFKYCYSEGFGIRSRKIVDSNKEDQFMEIIDSDSSSVIEVFPPGDKENSEYAESGFSHKRPVSNLELSSSKSTIGPRKGWRPQENKALNLLDKLRLGLQCTVIQTERDIIIQNLTLEDLSTLRSRLQGLATFKNIEAEYDKNGQETARATIDRRELNLPFKGSESQIEPRIISSNKRGEESLKRKNTSSSADKKKQPTPMKDQSTTIVKTEDYSSAWVRPKVRSVKKIRKLYTQSASTPNILARSQGSNRPDTSSQSSNRPSSGKPQSSVTDSINNPPHCTVAPVSFYPQITSVPSNTPTEPLIEMKATKSEHLPLSTTTLELSTTTEVATTSHLSAPRTANLTATSSESAKRIISSCITSSPASGTPATAMSASQLLMLKKGTPQTTNDSESSPTSTISMSNNDQLFASQILKPFKKSIPASSPSKLEIDEDETEFELTPSIIAQTKIPDNAITLPFLTKPLIQPIVAFHSSPRRPIIHLAPNPFIQTNSSIPILTPLASNLLLTCSKLPTVDESVNSTRDNSQSLVVTATTAAGVQSNDKIPFVQSSVKIKHRKWTHNFLTSNSVNLREVLCAAQLKNVRPLLPAPTGNSSVTISRNAGLLNISTLSSASSTPITTTIATVKSPVTIPSTSTCTFKPISIPTKGSNVVLKSLLVGSNSSNDLCNLTKSPIWTSKYLTSNSSPVQDSKIKWQVGGSVVPSQPTFAIISKDNKSSIELVNPAGNK